ncbi:hypothetical protein F4677DRAFT_463956 [Hypoxylon crocopeplum]|nr:hypothetical protein F4677DRAFT_463956 [Hypoxylon crocopeplum]
MACHITQKSSTPGLDGFALQCYDEVMNKLPNLAISPASSFPQFSQLPPELRCKIWQETWEHRDIRPKRWIAGTVEMSTNIFDSYVGETFEARYIRAKHVSRTRVNWTYMKRAPTAQEEDALFMDREYVTATMAVTTPPKSLSVNRESREETLRHFEYAFGLTGSISSIYFNFDLDTLVFPLHSPLSTAFEKCDLELLRRITIPELAPILPGFSRYTGPWDDIIDHFLPKVDNEDEVVYFEEFKYTWRLLRQWFPSLRTINLESLDFCDRHETTGPEYSEELDIVRHLEVSLDSADSYCHTCMNLRLGIRERIDAIDVNAQPQENNEAEGDEVEDDEVPLEIRAKRTGFKQETLAIGRAPRGRGHSEEEDVTVTYWAFCDLDDPKPATQGERSTILGGIIRRCVARTLERALGHPTMGEYMIYKM